MLSHSNTQLESPEHSKLTFHSRGDSQIPHLIPTPELESYRELDGVTPPTCAETSRRSGGRRSRHAAPARSPGGRGTQPGACTAPRQTAAVTSCRWAWCNGRNRAPEGQIKAGSVRKRRVSAGTAAAHGDTEVSVHPASEGRLVT